MRVSSVASESPKITATAIGAHHVLDSAPATNFQGQEWISTLQPTAMGTKPSTVVMAVSKTGRSRRRPAVTIASSGAMPAWRTGAIRLPYALAIAGGALTYAAPGAYALAAASAPLNLLHP